MSNVRSVPGQGFLAEAPTEEELHQTHYVYSPHDFADIVHDVYIAKLIAARAETVLWNSIEANVYANKDSKGYYNGDSLQASFHDYVLAVITSRKLREERSYEQQDKRGI